MNRLQTSAGFAIEEAAERIAQIGQLIARGLVVSIEANQAVESALDYLRHELDEAASAWRDVRPVVRSQRNLCLSYPSPDAVVVVGRHGARIYSKSELELDLEDDLHDGYPLELRDLEVDPSDWVDVDTEDENE